AQTAENIVAYTTSSDTGTVMEELVAAQVANHMRLEHHIAFPERGEFGADFEQFGAAVDYQTAFHVWLLPLLRTVHSRVEVSDHIPFPERIALDGLGGGLFIGSSFSDESANEDRRESRIRGITRYLNRES